MSDQFHGVNANEVLLSPTAAIAAGGPWGEPQEFPTPGLFIPPDFDSELIPPVLRPHVVDVAERMGVPVEQIYLGTLLSAAALVGNTTRVYPKLNDESWAEAGNLFGLLIGSPSTKKTPAIEASLKTLKSIESSLRDEHSSGASRRQALATSLETQIQTSKKAIEAAAKAGDTMKREAAEEALTELFEMQTNGDEPVPRRLAGDATIEALAEIAGQNPRGVLVYRDEFLGLLKTMTRAGHENDRSFFNEGWNSGSYTVDRVTRTARGADPLTISVYGSIQPEPFRAFTRPLIEAGGDDGFLARIQLQVWTSAHRLSSPVDRLPNYSAADTATEVFQELERIGADILRRLGPGAFEGLHLDFGAQLLLDDWDAELTDRIRSPGVLAMPAFEGHLGKTYAATLRLALVLHMIEKAAGDPSTEITCSQASMAIETIRFFLRHAENTYEIGNDRATVLARRLAGKIEAGELAPFTNIRDLQRSLAKTTDEILAALQVLEDLDWAQLVEVPNPGARASKLLSINPYFASQETTSGN